MASATRRQRAVHRVTAVGNRDVAVCAEQLEIGPSQRVRRIPAVTRDVETPVACLVRSGSAMHERARTGTDRSRDPVSTRNVETAVPRAAAGAQRGVGNDGLMVVVAVRLV